MSRFQTDPVSENSLRPQPNKWAKYPALLERLRRVLIWSNQSNNRCQLSCFKIFNLSTLPASHPTWAPSVMGFMSLIDETFMDQTTFYGTINVLTRNSDQCNKNIWIGTRWSWINLCAGLIKSRIVLCLLGWKLERCKCTLCSLRQFGLGQGSGEAAAFVAGNGKRFISQTQNAACYSQLLQCSN